MVSFDIFAAIVMMEVRRYFTMAAHWRAGKHDTRLLHLRPKLKL